jgi:peroxiredoxin
MKRLLLTLTIGIVYTFSFAQTTLTEAVDFSLKDIDGNTIHLFQLLDEGNYVCIDFFSTSCGPCSFYSPDFQLSYEDFGQNQGDVYHMSICWGDYNGGVAYYQDLYGLEFPAVSGFEGGGNQVYWDYDIQSYPTVILIAPDHSIVEQYIWEPTQENINDAILMAGGTMVGVDELAVDVNFNIYPNPVSNGSATLSFSNKSTLNVEVAVFNLLGSEVYSKESNVFQPGNHEIRMDVSDLPAGTYFVTLKSDKELLGTSKMVVN